MGEAEEEDDEAGGVVRIAAREGARGAREDGVEEEEEDEEEKEEVEGEALRCVFADVGRKDSGSVDLASPRPRELNASSPLVARHGSLRGERTPPVVPSPRFKREQQESFSLLAEDAMRSRSERIERFQSEQNASRELRHNLRRARRAEKCSGPHSSASSPRGSSKRGSNTSMLKLSFLARPRSTSANAGHIDASARESPHKF
mmetsp:Transcript_1526/g.4060  ORF Transcript_1526/g.4060 Transcript_1526/m.4060 type:complete len:203 (+) Transcript_1526:450-1058(+)